MFKLIAETRTPPPGPASSCEQPPSLHLAGCSHTNKCTFAPYFGPYDACMLSSFWMAQILTFETQEIHPIPRTNNFKYSRQEIHTPNTTNQQFQIFTPLQLIKQVNCARIILLVNRNKNFFCCQLLCMKNKNSAFTNHHLQPNVDFGRDGKTHLYSSMCFYAR